jgi:hypothetical protein
VTAERLDIEPGPGQLRIEPGAGTSTRAHGAGSFASGAAILSGALHRKINHGLTSQTLTELGYTRPTPDELAEGAELRADTLRRQADPTIRQQLAAALRRLQ